MIIGSNEHVHVGASRKKYDLDLAMWDFSLPLLKNKRYKYIIYSKGVLSDILVLCARHRVGFHSMDSPTRHVVIVIAVNVAT